MNIPIKEIVFYFFAIMIVFSAIVVVSSKNIVRSVVALLFTLFGVAVLYVYLQADFLAATQVLLYVGGILTLLIFGVMLTHKITDLNLRNEFVQVIPAMLVSSAIALMLFAIIFKGNWNIIQVQKNVETTTPMIGNLLMTDFLLPFEIASMVLLAALLGAVVIARREKRK